MNARDGIYIYIHVMMLDGARVPHFPSRWEYISSPRITGQRSITTPKARPAAFSERIEHRHLEAL